jgi:leucyl-tRNA synthetase
MEKILDMVNQNVQDALKKSQDTTNKEHEKTQKQINELRKDFNEHQSKTKNTIQKEIYELKDSNTKYKRGFEQNYGKPQKNKSKRNPGNKKSLY